MYVLFLSVLLSFQLISCHKPFHPNDLESSHDIQPSEFESFMAVSDESKRWKDATIVYEVVLTDFRQDELDGMQFAMNVYQNETCLKFKKATFNDPFYAIIRRGSGGCNAILGQDQQQGAQTVNLGEGCRWYGLFLHELGHTIGLQHEHQHPDRDSGVNVLWDNVDPTMKVWFEKIDKNQLNMYGVPYDMQSVMHYGQWAFAKMDSENKPLTTIVAKNPEFQRYLYYVWMKDLSWGDAKRINRMYKCHAHCPDNIYCPEETGFINKHCQCETKQSFANRRCYDVYDATECQKRLPDCDKTGTIEQYNAFMNCRKTCRKCYEAI